MQVAQFPKGYVDGIEPGEPILCLAGQDESLDTMKLSVQVEKFTVYEMNLMRLTEGKLYYKARGDYPEVRLRLISRMRGAKAGEYVLFSYLDQCKPYSMLRNSVKTTRTTKDHQKREVTKVLIVIDNIPYSGALVCLA